MMATPFIFTIGQLCFWRGIDKLPSLRFWLTLLVITGRMLYGTTRFLALLPGFHPASK